MKAYRVQVGSNTGFTMLADDIADLFDRLMHMADAEDPRLEYMEKYGSPVSITPHGDVV